MRTLIFINSVASTVMLLLYLEMILSLISTFKREHPTAKFNETTFASKIAAIGNLLVRSLIPIYNIICIVGCLFFRESVLEQGYEVLESRIIEE